MHTVILRELIELSSNGRKYAQILTLNLENFLMDTARVSQEYYCGNALPITGRLATFIVEISFVRKRDPIPQLPDDFLAFDVVTQCLQYFPNFTYMLPG